MSIIALSGKMQSGKNLSASIIQYLIDKNKMNYTTRDTEEDLKFYLKNKHYLKCEWKQKAFADKLKNIVCLLINCTREQLEDADFKNKELGEEWRIYYNTYYKLKTNTKEGRIGKVHSNEEDAKKEIRENGIFFNLGNTVLETKILTPRLLMQLLGTDCGRNIIHPNIWVTSLFTEYKPKISYQGVIMNLGMSDSQLEKIGKPISEEYPNWLITDLRFENELKAVKDIGGISIRVTRNMMGGQGGAINDLHMKLHESEIALDNAVFDYVIDNSGSIEDLIIKVKEILIKEKII